MKISFLSGWTLILGLLSGQVLASSASLEVRLLETTDLHMNLLDFDYYKGQPSNKIGLVRTASLIAKMRAEHPNTLLVDNGDLIQGSPMGDYIAAKGIAPGEVHPAYQAMNPLGYEVGNIGNHEFNFGLEFLQESLNDAAFPYISANVFHDKGNGEAGEPLFQQYLLKKYLFTDTAGQPQSLTVGFIGFVPPQIMQWDKTNLSGKVVATDIKATAEALVPKMRAEGADIIVAIPHSGLSSEPYKALAENSSYYLAEVEGIDAILFGHAHAVFPSAQFANLPNVDVEKGTIQGVAAVMPGRWGDHLGVVDLTLEQQDGHWQVVASRSQALPIFSKEQGALVEADQTMLAHLQEVHQQTLDFVNQPIGQSSSDIYSYLALVQDDPSIQIVADAQRDYVEHFIQGDPDLAGLPVLSAAAPFKAGGRKDDPNGFTEVSQGTLTFRNAADLYLYPNTLVALKVSGAQVQEWLECSAGQFNQIDPAAGDGQPLLNWQGFRTYNFDVIDGVSYEIDVSQPPRYDGDCQLINADSRRISQLSYQGKPLDLTQTFLVASNNYRAYGGKFAGTGEAQVAFASPDENRQVLANYIAKQTREKGQVIPSADHNWRLKPLGVTVMVETSPSSQADAFIQAQARYPMQKLGVDEQGFARYALTLAD